MDSDTLSWAIDHLGSYLPSPEQNMNRLPTPNPKAATMPTKMEEIALQLSATAHQLIQSAIKCSDTTGLHPRRSQRTSHASYWASVVSPGRKSTCSPPSGANYINN